MDADKRKHHLAGAAIGLLAVGSVTFALALCCLAAWGKEAWDKRGHGTYDPADAWATLAGCVYSSLIVSALVRVLG